MEDDEEDYYDEYDDDEEEDEEEKTMMTLRKKVQVILNLKFQKKENAKEIRRLFLIQVIKLFQERLKNAYKEKVVTGSNPKVD